MAETLTWNFTGNDRLTDLLDKLSVTLSSVDRKLSEFGKTSTKVKAETKGLEDEVKQLGEKAEKTGDEVKRAFRGIDEEIAATAIELRALQLEFAKTGDQALFKQIGSKKSDLAGLSGVVKDLGGDAEKIIADALQGGAKTGLVAGFKDALSSLSASIEMPGLGQVGGGLAAALAVPALAGAGGALTGAAGLGAVGAGVAGAIAGDPERFRLAWGAQIQSVKADWISASKSFTDPTLAAISTIGPMVANWHLDKTLGAAAAYVQPLVTGIEGFVNGLEGGIADLVTNAGPVIATLSSVLPDIGQMVGEGLSAVAANSEGGAQALGDILQAAGGLVDVLLKIVGGAEAMYHGFKTADAEVANFIRDNRLGLGVLTMGLSEVALHVSDAFNSDEVQHFGKELDGVPSSIDQVGESAKKTADELKQFSDAFDEALGKNLDAQQAAIAYERSLNSLTDSIKRNGKSLDIHTKAGQDNREAILGVISAAEKVRESTIAETGDVQGATKAYQDQINTLRQHLSGLHLSKQAIDDLIGSADDVPTDLYIKVHVEGAGMLSGLAGAISSVAGAGASVSRHRALGGAVMPGGIYQVNEQGLETFQPSTPGTIRPASARGADGDVLGVILVRHVDKNGDEMRTELLELKRQRGLASLGLS